MSYISAAALQNTESSNILQRISKDDKTAVVECLDTYGKLVLGLAKNFTNTREDAEDAVQEIFIDIWKYAARFDATKSPEGAFITLIARRRLIDRLRKSKSQPQMSSFENVLQSKSSDADKKLQMFVEMRDAFKALEKLSGKQKQLVQMWIYNGMTQTEIAKLVNLPLGTVKSQMRRAIQKIRNSINSIEISSKDISTRHC